MTGHFMAAAQVELDDIKISGKPNWFYISDTVRHGFYSNCGSQMFWRNDNNNYLSVTGGSLDDSKDLVIQRHIFTHEKGNYYQIDAGLPQFEG